MAIADSDITNLLEFYLPKLVNVAVNPNLLILTQFSDCGVGNAPRCRGRETRTAVYALPLIYLNSD
jgi:hypothetical protein